VSVGRRVATTGRKRERGLQKPALGRLSRNSCRFLSQPAFITAVTCVNSTGPSALPSDTVPFRKAAPAAGRRGVLRDEHRVSFEGSLLAVVPGIYRTYASALAAGPRRPRVTLPGCRTGPHSTRPFRRYSMRREAPPRASGDIRIMHRRAEKLADRFNQAEWTSSASRFRRKSRIENARSFRWAGRVGLVGRLGGGLGGFVHIGAPFAFVVGPDYLWRDDS
jgi:hypothetical protein